MKKLYIIFLAAICCITQHTAAKAKKHKHAHINMQEYVALTLDCAQIESEMSDAIESSGKYPSEKDVIKRWETYLKKVGTVTALQLMKDLKKN